MWRYSTDTAGWRHIDTHVQWFKVDTGVPTSPTHQPFDSWLVTYCCSRIIIISGLPLFARRTSVFIDADDADSQKPDRRCCAIRLVWVRLFMREGWRVGCTWSVARCSRSPQLTRKNNLGMFRMVSVAIVVNVPNKQRKTRVFFDRALVDMQFVQLSVSMSQSSNRHTVLLPFPYSAPPHRAVPTLSIEEAAVRVEYVKRPTLNVSFFSARYNFLGSYNYYIGRPQDDTDSSRQRVKRSLHPEERRRNREEIVKTHHQLYTGRGDCTRAESRGSLAKGAVVVTGPLRARKNLH